MLRRLMPSRRPRTRGARRRVSLPLLVVFLSLLGLFSVGYVGATGYVPAPTAGRGFWSAANSTVNVGDGIQLKLTKFEKSYGGQSYSHSESCGYSDNPPGSIDSNSAGSFCFASYNNGLLSPKDTGFYFYYDILVPATTGGWKPSGYYVDAATKVPLLGDPLIDCTIKKSGSTSAAPGAPFRCDKGFDRSRNNDPYPRWTITANPVKVIDATDSAQVQTAAALIKASCQLYNTERCNWTARKSSVFAQDRRDWKAVTDWGNSCPPVKEGNESTLEFTRSVEISWSDTVGGSFTASIDALKFIASLDVEGHYEHSVAQTDTYSETFHYTIPLGYRSGLYLQHGMLQVTGDFSIVTSSGERYLIKNATFNFPLKEDLFVEGRGQPIVKGSIEHVDIPCSDKPPANGAPPPPGAKVGRATPTK